MLCPAEGDKGLMFRDYLYTLLIDEKRKEGIIEKGIKLLLFLLSGVYYLVLQIREICYFLGILGTVRLPIKVISIGNITLGGTGKTPMVEFLAERLKRKGRKVGVLVQGYGEKGKGEDEEARLLKELLSDIPVLAGKNRIKTGKEAIERYAVDTLILDDGFQYRCLDRDLDIVLIDATCPFANGYLLPRGFLREPLKGLKRADLLILTKINLIEEDELVRLRKCLHRQFPSLPFLEAEYKPLFLIDLIKGDRKEIGSRYFEKVLIFSAIGNPQAFLRTVRTFSQVEKEFRFPDHYQFKSTDVKKIIDFCVSKQIKSVICTEKDAIKIKRFIPLFLSHSLSIFSLRMRMEIKRGREKLDAFIHSTITD